VTAVDEVEGARVIDTTDRTFLVHVGGKIELRNKHPLKTRDDLSMAYTPGVARVCEAIAADPDKAFQYTIKRNSVAVVTDGTAVLGLGDIGPAAAMPVMEGKAMLFKEFAGVDAFPLCLDTKDTDEIVETVRRSRPGSAGSTSRTSPRRAASRSSSAWTPSCPSRSSTTTSTARRSSSWPPVLNACKLTGRKLEDLRVLVTGLGAAGSP
jgi:malate dehydrogenase (oxaloacetate-decarboxylating)